MSRAAVELQSTLMKRIAQGHTTFRDIALLDELLGCLRRRYLLIGIAGGSAAIVTVVVTALLVKASAPLWLLAGAYALGVTWLSIPKVQ